MAHHKTLLIVGAKTGGHLFPGLVVAQHWQQHGGKVVWVGGGYAMERVVVEEQHQLPLYTVRFDGLRGGGLRGFIRGLWQLPRALLQANNIIKKTAANVILATGGFIAVPMAIVARLRRCSFFIFNADSQPLLSTRLLSPLAREVWYGMKAEADHKNIITGIPLRSSVLSVLPAQQRYQERAAAQVPFRVLIVGGSSGAHTLNCVLPSILKKWHDDAAFAIEVVHQTGQKDYDAVLTQYQTLGIKAQVLPFINDIATQYAAADVVISRSGAITLAEIQAVGVAAVLIPLSASSTSHQVANARLLIEAGLAWGWLDNQWQDPSIAMKLLTTLNREVCQKRAVVMQKLAHQNVANDMCERLLQAH